MRVDAIRYSQEHGPDGKSRGRNLTRYRTDAKSLEVKTVVERMTLFKQPVLKLRDTTRGLLKLRALRILVYVWDGESCKANRFFLWVTQTVDASPQTKISLEDAKSECGMADYQVRKWNACRHHMALAMMTMLFMLSERISHEDSDPLLPCSDIEELLSRFLPQIDVCKSEIIYQPEYRHRNRLSAIKFHTRTSGKTLQENSAD